MQQTTIENRIEQIMSQLNSATGERFDELEREFIYLQGYYSGIKSNMNLAEFEKLYENETDKPITSDYYRGWVDGKLDNSI